MATQVETEYVRSTRHQPPSDGPRKAHILVDDDHFMGQYIAQCGRTVPMEEAIVTNVLQPGWVLCGGCARAQMSKGALHPLGRPVGRARW